MHSLLIFSEKASPRLEYVCRLIFTQHLGLNFSVTTDFQEFKIYNGAKIVYGSTENNDTVYIQPSGLLFEAGIKTQAIQTGIVNGITIPFYSGRGDLQFDVFAAIFYLITRYEEYLPFEPNQYGQFKATNSLAHKLGFLYKPVVDIWVEDLKLLLASKYPLLVFRQKKFTTTFTYDIDVAYAYKGRPFAVTFINIIKDVLKFNFSAIKERLAVLNSNSVDPFDTYKHIFAVKDKYRHNLLFFFLLGPKNKYNRNLNPYGSSMQRLMKKLAGKATAGIHPSYFANDSYLQLQHEKLLLESVINKKVAVSRQHYLRLVLPTTYENLIQAGITDDYSLGFAELPGFRAGTCSPFNFYNLKSETETTLTLHPNTFMEGTFIEDMQVDAAAVHPLMKQFVDEVKNVNGHFISIWHNHSLSNQNEWTGLREVHDSIAEYAAKF